jgi:hypothetical protein
MRRKKRKDRKTDKTFSEGITPHFNLPKNEYLLGFKRKNFNELWRWDTLEDVDFSMWKPKITDGNES